MGIYMSSCAIIGVKITPTSETKAFRVRGCNHAETSEPFCSNCGAKMWKTGTETVNQFQYLYDDFLNPVMDQLAAHFDGLIVIETDHEMDNVWIGYGATVENHENALIPLRDYEQIKNEIKEVLEGFGVWEQCKDSFGLWVLSTGR